MPQAPAETSVPTVETRQSWPAPQLGPPPTEPRTWNVNAVWPPPTGGLPQVARSDHVAQGVPKAPPGFCHLEFAPRLAVKPDQNSWPPTVKSRFTTIEIQYVPCASTHGESSVTERPVCEPSMTPGSDG